MTDAWRADREEERRWDRTRARIARASVAIDRLARMLLSFDPVLAGTWDDLPDETKDRYRRMANMALTEVPELLREMAGDESP